MESLRRTAYTQHPALDKRSCCAGVVLQQFLDGHFRINLYHDRVITSSMTGIFALAQRCEKNQGKERSVENDKISGMFSKNPLKLNRLPGRGFKDDPEIN
jgi:hypothetical protein